MNTILSGVDLLPESGIPAFPELVPSAHPLRRMRNSIDIPLDTLRDWLQLIWFDANADSIAVEKLVRAILLQSFFAVNDDREMIDRIWSSPLFRWFVDIAPSEQRWDPTRYAAYRRQLLGHEIVREIIARALESVDLRDLQAIRPGTGDDQVRRRSGARAPLITGQRAYPEPRRQSKA